MPSESKTRNGCGENADAIAKKFRGATPPILGRVNEDRFLLDLRTIFDADDVIPNFAGGGLND